jgi:ribose transport system ATP-binding protein
VAESEVALRVSRLSKAFPGAQALLDVDLDVRRGEIHALVGGNGSGKSTLVKILAGVHDPDAGTIEVGSRIFRHGLRPGEGRAAGLHFVHQDPTVFLDLSIADNLAIGRGFETDGTGRIRWRDVRSRTREILERFEIDAQPEMHVGALRPSERTMVAIARALQDQEGQRSGVLVLDEPTTSLPDPEAALLLDALRRYATAGQSMLFVSHDLDEVIGFAHRVTVLRDGRRIGTSPTADVDHDRLVEQITGRPLEQMFPETPKRAEGEAVLEVRDLSGARARGVSFSVRAGEVVGLAGLIGSGADEIVQCVFGAVVPAGGTVLVAGTPLPPGRPAAAIARDVYYVPGERSRALFADLSLRENLSAADVSRYWRHLLMQNARERRDARETMRRFTIRAKSEEQPIASLSGGNQQKAVVARWLRHRPKVLLLEEPTQGVDVGARADVYMLIRSAADQGAAVLLTTLDFAEIAGLCDRALVVSEGRIVAELSRPHIDHARLTELAYGRIERGVVA